MPNKYDSFDREDLVSLTKGNVPTDATILCMCPDIKDMACLKHYACNIFCTLI